MRNLIIAAAVLVSLSAPAFAQSMYGNSPNDSEYGNSQTGSMYGNDSGGVTFAPSYSGQDQVDPNQNQIDGGGN